MSYGRLDKLVARRTDPSLVAMDAREVYKRMAHSESVRYAIGAMQPIDAQYTQTTIDQGERVKNQLSKNLTCSCDFDYQGSVTNDTHIKANSDIDLLAVYNGFYALETPQVATNPYAGNPIQDLLNLREEVIEILKSSFPEAAVDASGKTAVSIEGGSLRRKVDVVPSNWFHTNDYTRTKEKIFKGVEVLNIEVNSRIKNTPFLHNERIDKKDQAANGGLRKAIRLMKSLKYDSEVVSLSSYDIAAIAYNIESHFLASPKNAELVLIEVCLQYCSRLISDDHLRSSIFVPDGHRAVFSKDHATLAGLIALTKELRDLGDDIMKENTRSFIKLSEARVEY